MAEPYVGEIRMFAGNFAPLGWMLCQGQLLPISENETLFNLIGTTYGGDGQSTFAPPNLQSRVPVHEGGGFVLAEIGGLENVTLTVPQLPAHNHPVFSTSNSGTQSSPQNAVWASDSAGITAEYDAPTGQSMSPSAIHATGGSQPHSNIQPYLAINFIISLFGVFPSQS